MMRPGKPLELTSATGFGLDLLRAVAAQVVLFGHAFDFFNVFSFLGDADAPPQPQRMAVVVFFLLSGFLIARSAARSGATLGCYLAARTRRIYSGLIPALVLIALVDALPFGLFELDFPGSANTIWAFAANLLHLQGYPWVDAPVFGTGDPLWTLSIEWWLYLFYGALVMSWSGAKTALPGYLVRALVVLIATPMVLYNLVEGPGDGLALVWFFGVGCFWWLARGPENNLPRRFSLVGLVLFSAAALVRVYFFAPAGLKAFDRGFTVLLTLSFLCLLLVCQESVAAPARWLSGLVRGLAGYSYTLYLTHFTVLTLLYELRGPYDDRLLLAAAVLVCNLVAFLLARVGEVPVQRRYSQRMH